VATNLNDSIDDLFLLKKAPQKESGIILTEGKCSSQPFLDEMQRSKNLDALALTGQPRDLQRIAPCVIMNQRASHSVSSFREQTVHP